MFRTLLLVTFAIAAAVSFAVARLFDRSHRQILARLVAPDLAGAWHRYLVFALYVVGISGGARLHRRPYRGALTGPGAPGPGHTDEGE